MANKQYVRDTVQTDKNGMAHFVGEEDWDGGIYLIAVNGISIFEFVYSGTEKGFSITTDSEDALKNMKIKGSTENVVVHWLPKRAHTARYETQKLGERYQEHKKAKNKDSMKVIEDISAEISEDTKKYQIEMANDYPGTMVAMIINLMREPEVPSPLLP